MSRLRDGKQRMVTRAMAMERAPIALTLDNPSSSERPVILSAIRQSIASLQSGSSKTVLLEFVFASINTLAALLAFLPACPKSRDWWLPGLPLSAREAPTSAYSEPYDGPSYRINEADMANASGENMSQWWLGRS